MTLTKIEVYVERKDGVSAVEDVCTADGGYTGDVLTGMVDVAELCRRWRALPAVAVRLLTGMQGEDITDADEALKELGYVRNVGGNVRRGYNWVLRNFTREGKVLGMTEIWNRLLGMNTEQLKI